MGSALALMDLPEETDVIQKWEMVSGQRKRSGESQIAPECTLKLQVLVFAFRYNITQSHIVAKDFEIQKVCDLFRDVDAETVTGHCLWINYWIDTIVGNIPVEGSSTVY